MIRVINISYTYGLKPIFEKASFTIGKNVKAGLVGPNGAGKSTLFKLLTREDHPSDGDIVIEGSVSHVPQEIKYSKVLEESNTIREYVDPLSKKADFELAEMMRGLELEDLSIDGSPKNLSGGQKTKLAIARALIEEPDILLLDEPTNFLDIKGKEWVMNFLAHYPKTLLMVSHDLVLLDEYIDKVIAVNSLTYKTEEYKGNYTKYLELKEEREEQLKKKILQEQKHIKHMEEGLRRMQRFTSKKGVRQRTQLRHRIEKMKDNLPELPKEIKLMNLKLPDAPHIGELPIRAVNLSKSYGDEVILENVSLSIKRGERVALIGPNGAGKSTFIKMLVGISQPDSGEVIRDRNLKLGYYSQEFEQFNFDKTLIETVQDICEIPEYKARPFLASFLFTGEKVYQTVGSLSGGEKTRLSIALLVLQENNLLILDEPTTYLDVLSQRIILEAIKKYSGALLVVSHTEEFIEELAPNRVMFLPENRVTHWIPEFIDKVSEV